MLRQIRYFQSVVRNNSFSEAAEECHISQSAISQQIKALENELGVALLERKNRKFALTPAGAHFYQKSLVLLADYDRMCREAATIAHGEGATLRLGYPRDYAGQALYRALDAFAARYPQVSVGLQQGTHEELFRLLRDGGADLVLNDQRRAFSEEYVNHLLGASALCAQLSARSPLAVLPALEPEALKNLPCLLVCPEEQLEGEADYYRTVVGLQGSFGGAADREEARLRVIAGQGFLPVAGARQPADGPLRCVPLCRGGQPILRRECLFWKKENPSPYPESFARLLQAYWGEN